MRSARITAAAALAAVSTGCLLFNSLDGYEGVRDTPDARVLADALGAPPDQLAPTSGAVDFAWALSEDGGKATPFAIYPFDGGAPHAVGCPIPAGALQTDGTPTTRAPPLMTRGSARFTGDERGKLAFLDGDELHVVSAASTCGAAPLDVSKLLTKPKSVPQLPRLNADGSSVLFRAVSDFVAYGVGRAPTNGQPGVLTEAVDGRFGYLVAPEWNGSRAVWVEVSTSAVTVLVDGKPELGCGEGHLWGGTRRFFQSTPLGGDKVVLVAEGDQGGRRTWVFDLAYPITGGVGDRCPQNTKASFFIKSEGFAGDVGVSPDGKKLAWVTQKNPAATAIDDGFSAIRFANAVEDAPSVTCANESENRSDDVAPHWLTPDVLTWTRVPRARPAESRIMIATVTTNDCGAPSAAPVPAGFTGLLGMANESRGALPPVK